MACLRLVVVFIISLVAISHGQCVPDTTAATLLEADVEMGPFITFDDLGFSGAEPWTDAQPGLVVVDSEFQTITLTGAAGCKLERQFFLDGINWYNNLAWPGESEVPGYYLAANENGIECRLTFANPITKFTARMNGGNVNTAANIMSINDAEGNRISCTTITTKSEDNGFFTLGFDSTVPITSIRWTSGILVADRIQWMCKNGFKPEGNTCVDRNECDESACSPDAACENSIGSFNCTCNEGYVGDGIGAEGCRPLQCTDQPCDPNAACSDNGETYTCTCHDGYQGDGLTCTGAPGTSPSAGPSAGPASNAPGTSSPSSRPQGTVSSAHQLAATATAFVVALLSL